MYNKNELHDENEIYDKAILYAFKNDKIKIQSGIVTIYKTLKMEKLYMKMLFLLTINLDILVYQ